jgi:hypothetical protein
MENVKDFEAVRSNKAMIVYQGEFTREITKSVLHMTEENLDSLGEESVVKRKVFNVVVECLQNICKHADFSTPEEERRAVFMIDKDEESYVISFGNLISNNNIEMLQEKLDRINELDKDGLKVLYKDVITQPGWSDKGGAGLGFIDIARKSGQKLEFDFQKVNNDSSYFLFRTKVKRAS